MRDFYNQHGIIHQRRCAYTPKQNSVVERKHQHIFIMARSLKFQATLPLPFWSDCILTAVHLINRILKPLLQNKSPYELFFNKLPDYDHLKTFGCLAYVSTYSHTRNKFSPRSTQCNFLGYPIGIKRYKYLDPLTNKFLISCHVLFMKISFLLNSLLLTSILMIYLSWFFQILQH